MSSFQGVGIEVFHCVQKCPWFRELEYIYFIQKFHGGVIEVFCCIINV